MINLLSILLVLAPKSSTLMRRTVSSPKNKTAWTAARFEPTTTFKKEKASEAVRPEFFSGVRELLGALGVRPHLRYRTTS